MAAAPSTPPPFKSLIDVCTDVCFSIATFFAKMGLAAALELEFLKKVSVLTGAPDTLWFTLIRLLWEVCPCV